MTYYDLIKKYGKGINDDRMWKAIKRVSDFIEPMKETEPHKFWQLMKSTYADMQGAHFNQEFADWQINNMFYIDKNGKKLYGPYWTDEEMRKFYDTAKTKIKSMNYNFFDYSVTMTMIKSDNYEIYKRWWPSATEEELDVKFMEAAVNWLNDDDSPYGDEKIWQYFNN